MVNSSSLPSLTRLSRHILRVYLLVLSLICVTPVYPRGARQHEKQNRTADNKTTPSALRIAATQVLLDRSGYSPGQIDGRWGNNGKNALAEFQISHGMPADITAETSVAQTLQEALGINPFVPYQITEQDAAGPFCTHIPEDMNEKAKLPFLAYQSILEMLAERFHCSPDLLKQLNPTARFSAGDTIKVPNVEQFLSATPKQNGQDISDSKEHVMVTVSRTKSALTVQNSSGAILFFAPVTTGSAHDPLPIGEWKIEGVEKFPKFSYDPKLFWDADRGDSKTKLPPGPNNPVGTVWISLTKKHYGIHGTPEPGKIGHSESHGCVRLTNWDAMKLASLVKPGTKVLFVE